MGSLDAAVDSALTGTTPITPLAKDPLDNAVDGVLRAEKSRAFTTLFGASKDNPDRVAKAKQLAERTGLGVDLVLSDLDTIQQRLTLNQTQQQVTDSPALTRAMQDPTFAKLTQDDVPQLTQLEQWWRQSAPKAVTKSVPTDRQYKRLFDHLRQQNPYMDVEQVRATAQKEVDSGRWAQTYLKLPRASRTWGEAIDDTVLGFGESANSLGGSVIELARQNPMAAVNYLPGVRQWYDDTQAALRRGQQFYANKESPAVKDFDAQLAAAPWWQMPGMILSDPGMALQQLSRSSAYLLPGMAAGRFGALPALGVNALVEGADAAANAREQVIKDGGFPAQQDKAATLAFVTATAISLGINKALGTHKIEADFWKTGRPGAAVTKLLTREVPQEMVEEGGNQFGQNVGLIHTTQPNRALFEGVAKAAALGGTLGLAQGGLMSGTGKVLDSVLGRIAPDVEQVAQTRTTAEVLQKLHETVLTSKTLPRDAATFGQYLQTLQETHGEALPAVYVSPTALQNALLQSGLDVNTTLAAMPETARQIDDALLTGAEVRIPLTEYATQLAPVFDQLLPEVRTQPDGLNQRDADALLQDLPDLVRAATVRQMDAAAVSEQWRQEVADIEQQVLAGLDATGKFHRTERQKMAGLLSGAYGVLAHRSGVTPAQFAAAHPLPQIVAERFMQQRGLMQEETPSVEDLLAMLGEVDTINIEAPKMTKEDIDAAETQFLSDAPAGATIYRRDAKLLKRVRQASDLATHETRGNPETTRSQAGPLGPFTGYEIEGEILPGDSFNPGGLLAVKVFGDEQVLQGLDAEPALTFTVTTTGELTVNGPSPSGETFAAFKERGWADYGRDATGEIQPGWSALKDPNNPKGHLPITQIYPLLADVHARVRAWRMEEYVGLHWSRATGAMGGNFGANPTWVYFQNEKAPKPKVTKEQAAQEWLSALSRVRAGNMGYVPRMHTPAVLRAVGVKEATLDLPSRALMTIGADHPEIPLEIVQRLPELLRDPVYVIPHREGGITVVTDAQDSNGNLVLVGVRDGRIRTVYGKDRTEQTSEQRVFALVRDALTRKNEKVYVRNDEALVKTRASKPGPDGANSLEVSPKFAASIVKQKDVVKRHGTDFYQGSKDPLGSFGPDSNTLALYEKANLSTFLHESGHFFLELLADLASQPNAPTAITSDFDTLLQWFALPEGKTWDSLTLEEKRPYHEQFARGFEAYLFEGKAPAPRLEKAFSAFRAWLVRIYKQLTALNVELTDEVRGVFDRLLATEQEIAEVTARRALEPLFASKPENMTPEDWAAYQALPADATEEAVRQVEQRALRDMRWLSNAKSRALKELQKEANGKRVAVREDVKKQMAELPIYRAREWLQKGSMRAEDGTEIQANAGYKFNIADLEALYPSGGLTAAPNWRQLGYGKYGMLANEGLHPDVVAEMFGFPSGDDLVRQLLEWPTPAEYLRAETDRLMLERHGDLVDDVALERAAEEALVNDARVKMVATELAAVKAVYGNANEINAAAKQYAVDAVGRMRVGELRPQQHLQASTRAGKDAERALAKGNTELVAQKKREQVLQLWLYKEALAAQREETARRAFFAKVLKGTNEQLVAKNRDPDVVHTARLVLAEFGLGTERQINRSREYVERVREYDPGMASQMSASLDAAAEMGKPYPTLSIAEARSVQTEVEALWEQARRSRQREVDGKLLDQVEITGELVATLDARGLPARAPGEGQAVTRGEALKMQFLSAGAALRRVEAWTRAVDKVKDGIGAFRRYIFLPIKDAADNYRAALAQRLRQLKDALAPIEQDFTGELIAAPELGHTFGKGSVGGMAELFHALLHTGNDSNKSKLLRGMRNQDKQAWAAQLADGTLDTRQWDAFIARMVQEGRLRKEHFDALQAVWGLLEEMKPALQEAHRQATGRYFDEIPARAFDTPWGRYRGGYVPVVHDTQAVTDAGIRALIADEHNALAFTFTGAASGMTKSRVESYAVPLLLDVRSLAQHIDKVLIYSYMEVPVRDVRRTLKDISGPLSRYDRAALEGMLTPWLQRSVTQQVETPAAGWSGVMSVFRTLRSRAGMAVMFANVSNTVQQITGFSLAAVRVPPKYLLHATVLAVTRGPELMRGVADSSIYMKHRMQNESATMDAAIDGVLLNPNPLQKAERWTREHAYFMQAAFDNVMSPIIWTAKYSQALEAGLSELDARREADSIVRETQGSTLAEDVSRMESGNAFVRLFTQFLGYFNMQYNLLLTEFGNAPGLGRKLYVTLLGFSIPAIVAQAIALAFKGGPEDEDKDGEYLDDWLYQTVVLGQFKTAAAFVPGVGALATTAVNKGDSKPYNDRMSLSPAVSVAEAVAGMPATAWKVADSTKDQRDSRVIKDIATALSLATGLPVSAAAKPLAYQADIGEGRIPEPNPLERTRGYITGSAPPR